MNALSKQFSEDEDVSGCIFHILISACAISACRTEAWQWWLTTEHVTTSSRLVISLSPRTSTLTNLNLLNWLTLVTAISSSSRVCDSRYLIYCEKKWISDNQQFHQYQQNKQPPLTSNNWTSSKTHGIWHWKSISWLRAGTNKWRDEADLLQLIKSFCQWYFLSPFII